MTMLRRLSILAALVTLTACSDQTGPQVSDDAVFAKGGRWATVEDGSDGSGGLVGSTTTCTGDEDLADMPPCTLRHRWDAPPLMSYDTSFTAVQGERSVFVLHYVDPSVDPLTHSGWDVVGTWFMRVSIPRDAQLLDESGSLAAVGDSVEIMVLVDRERFLVEFGPHGSTFPGKKPVLLEFSLEFAEVVGADRGQPDIWYRPDAQHAWSPLGAQFDRKGMKVQAPIKHFSGYAVAW